MKKIISILCAITIALSTLIVCDAASMEDIKIDGTVGEVPA